LDLLDFGKQEKKQHFLEYLQPLYIYYLYFTFYKKAGGEGANRTHQRRVDRLSTVLKTAGTTRHPSLSLSLDVVNLVWNELDDKEVYAKFLEVRI
jgi:hypothetical protein